MSGQADDEQTYERLKWTVLGEAPGYWNAGIAYHWAKRAFPNLPTAELDPIVRRVLLELLDEGLIYFYWGSWDGGADHNDAVTERFPQRPSRAEVDDDLSRGGDAEPIPRTVWFTSTEPGNTKLAELPARTFLGYEDAQ